MKSEKNILFGISSCSYQTEGHNYNSDWHLFETKHFPEDKNHLCRESVDYWNRWQTDHEYLSELNVDAFRTSIEWSRVQPTEHTFDIKAIETYRQMFLDLKKRNIKIVVTFFHYVMPQWFQKRGGFEKKENIRYYKEFQERILKELGDLIDMVTPINEIFVYASLGYMLNHFPPRKTNFFTMIRVIRNLMKAHFVTASTLLNKKYPISIGTAEQIRLFTPSGNNLIEKLTAKLMNYFSTALISASIAHNRYYFPLGFFNRIHTESHKALDFIGIQFYPSVQIKLSHTRLKPSVRPLHHNRDWVEALMNSPINTADLLQVLSYMSRLGKPLFITEFGIQSKTDEKRVNNLQEIIKTLLIAQKKGYTIVGFLYFTLLDCFEWTQGFTQKFGLVHIDRENNLKRTVKKSFYAYKRAISNFRK